MKLKYQVLLQKYKYKYFRPSSDTDYLPSDESLEQGRNRNHGCLFHLNNLVCTMHCECIKACCMNKLTVDVRFIPYLHFCFSLVFDYS